MKQVFAHTEPTPAEGYAKFLQMFENETRDAVTFKIRDTDGRVVEITLTEEQFDAGGIGQY